MLSRPVRRLPFRRHGMGPRKHGTHDKMQNRFEPRSRTRLARRRWYTVGRHRTSRSFATYGATMTPPLNRRTFLETAILAAASVAGARFPRFLHATDEKAPALIVREKDPENLEFPF